MGKRLQKEEEGVWLEGGPMSGWFVKPDAPALKPEWGEDHGGRYELSAEPNADGIRTAKWVKA